MKNVTEVADTLRRRFRRILRIEAPRTEEDPDAVKLGAHVLNETECANAKAFLQDVRQGYKYSHAVDLGQQHYGMRKAVSRLFLRHWLAEGYLVEEKVNDGSPGRPYTFIKGKDI